jgi:TIR domain
MTTVRALLSLHGPFTKRVFRLSGLASTLRALSPAGVDLCFRLAANGSTSLLLACDLGTNERSGSAGARADVFRERLLRGDIAGRFECELVADAHRVDLPGEALRVALPGDAALPSGKWICFPTSLVDAAAKVFDDAAAHGAEVAYRVSLRKRAPDLALAKRLVPALADLSVRGGRVELAKRLRSTVDLLKTPGWFADEALLVASAQRLAVETLVMRQLADGAAFVQSDLWQCAWNDAPPAADATWIQQARSGDFDETLLEAIVPSLPDEGFPAAQQAPVNEGDYLFISYAHADGDYAERVIAYLQSTGANLWFDKGIEPGAIWDEQLEQRIRACGAVVVCLTANYEASRYCRREIRFADLIHKRILPIAPAPRAWGEGLQLMFQDLQIGTADSRSGLDAFRRAVESACPQIFASAFGRITAQG